MARPSLKSKQLRKVSIEIHAETEEAVQELLQLRFRNTPSIYSDFETGQTIAIVYLDADEVWDEMVELEIRAELERIQECGLNIGPCIFKIEWIKREDWANSWKRHFKPMSIGGKLLIRPGWIKRKAKKGQALVVLDPGLSFGTGQHATTSFCLHQLVKARKKGTKQSFLDMGTGSGILAIAAAKLGYKPVDAFDYDPEAVRVAKENAAKNKVADKLKLKQADLTKLPAKSRDRYDIVCANLIYDLLIAESAKISARVQPDGLLVLAGILETQFALVEETFAQYGWKLVSSKVEKEWRSGSFRRAKAK
ncbi:MAG TPA: 50S ribosomal protein L11 methyltransferase [Verrucomicrobiae bacterium]